MNVLFDLYGTLADIRTDEESPAFWERLFLNGAGFTREEYLSRCRAAAEELPEGGEIDLLAVFRSLTGKRGEELLRFAKFFRESSRERLRLFPHAKELLSALHGAGAGVYLFSNAQACFTHDELRLLGLENAFDGVLFSSDAGMKKPSSAFFEEGFRRFGLRKEECIFVGNDLKDDVGGAHGVGMRCLYLETEQSGRYPHPPVPDFFARDLFEAEKVLLPLIGKA